MNALTTRQPQLSIMDPAGFEHMQRVAGVLAASPLFPEHLRKTGNATANGVLVLNMAQRLNEDPLTVAQNIYFVGGKPGWSASYMISKANQHGVFKNPIDWDITGTDDDLEVVAFAEMAATGRRVEAEASMAMAKAEGWAKNPKYKSMPKQMLRYRSAVALIRLYCPEVMVGVPSTIEVEDEQMRDITPSAEATEPTLRPAKRSAAQKLAELADDNIEDAQTTESDDGNVVEQDPADEAGGRDVEGEVGEPADDVTAGDGSEDLSPAPDGETATDSGDNAATEEPTDDPKPTADQAYKMGRRARQIDQGLRSVPTDIGVDPDLTKAWQDGWRDEDKAKKAGQP